MSSVARLARQKISTTISPATFSHLERMIERGEARNLAEAIDLVIEQLSLYENRERLERDTVAYFANLSEEEDAEEKALESALSQSATGIDFDR